MQVTHVDADVPQVVSQFLGGALGQRGHQHPFLFLQAQAGFINQIIDLPRQRLHHHLRIDQPGGTHDLLNHPPFGPGGFPLGGRGAHINRRALELLEFLKIKGPVIHGARQPKPEIDQHGFTRAVTRVHAADLRDRNMRLIDHEQKVLRKKIQQCERARTRRAGAQMARIIFNAGAKTHLEHHLQIVLRAHFDALGLNELVVFLEPGDPVRQFFADAENGPFNFVHRRHELFAGEHGYTLQPFEQLAGERFEPADALHLFAEKLDAQGIFAIRGAQLHRVAARAKFAPREFDVVPLVLQVDELTQKLLAR